MTVVRVMCTIFPILFAMAAGGVVAMDIPRGDAVGPDGQVGHYVFEKHLAGYSNVVVDAQGNARVWALFTSEIKFGGERNVSVTVQVWAGDNLLYGTNLTARTADAGFHGGHVRENREAHFSLTPEQWAKVTSITYAFGQSVSPAVCAFFMEKYQEGNNLLDPQLTGCPI